MRFRRRINASIHPNWSVMESTTLIAIYRIPRKNTQFHPEGIITPNQAMRTALATIKTAYIKRIRLLSSANRKAFSAPKTSQTTAFRKKRKRIIFNILSVWLFPISLLIYRPITCRVTTYYTPIYPGSQATFDGHLVCGKTEPCRNSSF